MESSVAPMEAVSAQEATNYHQLYDNWTLWAHLPHDTDWTVKSYKKILAMINNVIVLPNAAER